MVVRPPNGESATSASGTRWHAARRARRGQHGREVVRYSRAASARALSRTWLKKLMLCMCQWRVRDDGARYISSERNYAHARERVHMSCLCSLSLAAPCSSTARAVDPLPHASQRVSTRVSTVGHIIAEHDYEHSRVDTTHELARCTKGKGKLTRDVTFRERQLAATAPLARARPLAYAWIRRRRRCLSRSRLRHRRRLCSRRRRLRFCCRPTSIRR